LTHPQELLRSLGLQELKAAEKAAEEAKKLKTDYEKGKQLEAHYEANMVPEESVSKYTIGVYPENGTLPHHWPRCYTIHLPCALERIERLTRLLILARRRK